MSEGYAAGTEVPVERSRAEIERTLIKYGASQFVYGWDEHRAVLDFVIERRRVRFVLPLPKPDDKAFWSTPTGRVRTDAAARKEFEQAMRSQWRKLALVIKAKLEAVSSSIVTFDEEFMAHIVLPGDGGQTTTVGQEVLPKLVKAIESGERPALLPGI